jgi:cytochrome c556
MRKPTFLAPGIAILLLITVAPQAHEQATGMIKERMDAMEAMAKSMKVINQRLKEQRGLELVQREAKSIADAALKMPTLFPAGSNQHPSGAKAAIWSNWTDFEKKARSLAEASASVAEADLRNPRLLSAQARRVSESCVSCHELYRTKHRH